MYEFVWRDEVANLCLTDDSLNVVLTEDDKLVLEFAKSVEERLRHAQQALLAEADSEGEGPVAALRRKVAKSLSRRLPKWIDAFQENAGLGVEHRLADVEATLKAGTLVIRLPSGKKMSLDQSQIDLGQAERFLEKLGALKAKPQSP